MKAQDMAKLMRPLRRGLRAIISRGFITAVAATGQRIRLKAGLREGEVADDVELFEPFGFTGVPLPDRDGLLTFAVGGNANHRIAINAGGRYHRPTDLEPGEACVYNQHGDRVTIRNDRGIYVDAAERVVVNTKAAEIHASERITLDSPLVHCTHALQVDGNINGRAMVNDQYGTIQAVRITYNDHNHTHDGETTSAPSQQMGAS